MFLNVNLSSSQMLRHLYSVTLSIFDPLDPSIQLQVLHSQLYRINNTIYNSVISIKMSLTTIQRRDNIIDKNGEEDWTQN